MERLLIAGIDPGTTTAFALLDLDGSVISISSQKNATHADLLLHLRGAGKIVTIGHDVLGVPPTIKRIATQLGCDTVGPDHDLRYREKIKIVDRFLKPIVERVEINNRHERDALAAALYGLKQLRPLLKKIDDHLAEHHLEHLRERVQKMVLIDKIAITKAVRHARRSPDAE